MAKLRLDYLLISTAITVALSTVSALRAAPVAFDVIAAAIPVPETADVKPLTPADVVQTRTPPAPSAATAAPAAAPAATQATPEQKAQDTAVVPPDPVAAKIKDLLASNRFFASKKERAAAEAFYSARTYAPLWETANAANDRAKAAIAYLGTVDSEGLDPAEYAVPNFKNATSPDQLAEADLRMTATLLTYARHAQNGRINQIGRASCRER